MLPAYQNFGTDQLRSRYLRLIVERELLLLDGFAQSFFQNRAFDHHCLHGRVEESQRIPPRLLGPVHRDVGLLQQRVTIRLLPHEQVNAHARRAVIRMFIEQVNLIERGHDLLANPLGLRCGLVFDAAQVRQDDDKLVPAQAGHGIFRANASDQALGNLLQQEIAHVVAERVVERFEVIQVDEQ